MPKWNADFQPSGTAAISCSPSGVYSRELGRCVSSTMSSATVYLGIVAGIGGLIMFTLLGLIFWKKRKAADEAESVSMDKAAPELDFLQQSASIATASPADHAPQDDVVPPAFRRPKGRLSFVVQSGDGGGNADDPLLVDRALAGVSARPRSHSLNSTLFTKTSVAEMGPRTVFSLQRSSIDCNGGVCTTSSSTEDTASVLDARPRIPSAPSRLQRLMDASSSHSLGSSDSAASHGGAENAPGERARAISVRASTISTCSGSLSQYISMQRQQQQQNNASHDSNVVKTTASRKTSAAKQWPLDMGRRLTKKYSAGRKSVEQDVACEYMEDWSPEVSPRVSTTASLAGTGAGGSGGSKAFKNIASLGKLFMTRSGCERTLDQPSASLPASSSFFGGGFRNDQLDGEQQAHSGNESPAPMGIAGLNGSPIQSWTSINRQMSSASLPSMPVASSTSSIHRQMSSASLSNTPPNLQSPMTSLHRQVSSASTRSGASLHHQVSSASLSNTSPNAAAAQSPTSVRSSSSLSSVSPPNPAAQQSPMLARKQVSLSSLSGPPPPVSDSPRPRLPRDKTASLKQSHINRTMSFGLARITSQQVISSTSIGSILGRIRHNSPARTASKKQERSGAEPSILTRPTSVGSSGFSEKNTFVSHLQGQLREDRAHFNSFPCAVQPTVSKHNVPLPAIPAQASAAAAVAAKDPSVGNGGGDNGHEPSYVSLGASRHIPAPGDTTTSATRPKLQQQQSRGKQVGGSQVSASAPSTSCLAEECSAAAERGACHASASPPEARSHRESEVNSRSSMRSTPDHGLSRSSSSKEPSENADDMSPVQSVTDVCGQPLASRGPLRRTSSLTSASRFSMARFQSSTGLQTIVDATPYTSPRSSVDHTPGGTHSTEYTPYSSITSQPPDTSIPSPCLSVCGEEDDDELSPYAQLATVLSQLSRDRARTAPELPGGESSLNPPTMTMKFIRVSDENVFEESIYESHVLVSDVACPIGFDRHRSLLALAPAKDAAAPAASATERRHSWPETAAAETQRLVAHTQLDAYAEPVELAPRPATVDEPSGTPRPFLQPSSCHSDSSYILAGGGDNYAMSPSLTRNTSFRYSQASGMGTPYTVLSDDELADPWRFE
eukprot:scpid15234/ scgid25855/ 